MRETMIEQSGSPPSVAFGELNVTRPNFEEQVGRRPELLDSVTRLIEARTNGILDMGERAAARYEVEYASGIELSEMMSANGIACAVDPAVVLAEGCNYTYWTPLMDRDTFNGLTGLGELQGKRIIEAGAGSGDFMKMLFEWGTNPNLTLAADISPTSARRLSALGCDARCGRFDQVTMPGEHFDGVFLSYFVDRDDNQQRTFNTTVSSLAPGGMLVLEGLFPCVPVDPSGMPYADPSATVTHGESVEQDVSLVMKFLNDQAGQQGMRLRFNPVGIGERMVYSRDGFETLPSGIIVAKRVS